MVVTGSGARDVGEVGATRGGGTVSDRRSGDAAMDAAHVPAAQRRYRGRARCRGQPAAWRVAMAQDAATINALVPAAPDPTPPGVPDSTYSQATNDAFAEWQAANDAKVSYEAVAWPQLHDKMATNFASGTHVHDVVLHVRLGAGVRAVPDAARRHAAAGSGRRPAAVVASRPSPGTASELGRRLHPLAADALLQHGASGTGRAGRSRRRPGTS